MAAPAEPPNRPLFLLVIVSAFSEENKKFKEIGFLGNETRITLGEEKG